MNFTGMSACFLSRLAITNLTKLDEFDDRLGGFMATRLSEEDAKRLLKHIDEDAPNVKAIQNIKAGRRVRMAMKAWEAKSKKNFNT